MNGGKQDRKKAAGVTSAVRQIGEDMETKSRHLHNIDTMGSDGKREAMEFRSEKSKRAWEYLMDEKWQRSEEETYQLASLQKNHDESGVLDTERDVRNNKHVPNKTGKETGEKSPQGKQKEIRSRISARANMSTAKAENVVNTAARDDDQEPGNRRMRRTQKSASNTANNNALVDMRTSSTPNKSSPDHNGFPSKLRFDVESAKIFEPRQIPYFVRDKNTTGSFHRKTNATSSVSGASTSASAQLISASAYFNKKQRTRVIPRKWSSLTVKKANGPKENVATTRPIIKGYDGQQNTASRSYIAGAGKQNQTRGDTAKTLTGRITKGGKYTEVDHESTSVVDVRSQTDSTIDMNKILRANRAIIGKSLISLDRGAVHSNTDTTREAKQETRDNRFVHPVTVTRVLPNANERPSSSSSSKDRHGGDTPSTMSNDANSHEHSISATERIAPPADDFKDDGSSFSSLERVVGEASTRSTDDVSGPSSVDLTDASFTVVRVPLDGSASVTTASETDDGGSRLLNPLGAPPYYVADMTTTDATSTTDIVSTNDVISTKSSPSATEDDVYHSIEGSPSSITYTDSTWGGSSMSTMSTMDQTIVYLKNMVLFR